MTGPRPVSEDAKPFYIEKEIPWFFVAWTTTPFTIPANRALALSAATQYAVLRASPKGSQGGDEEIWIVGEKCVAPLLEALQGAGKSWNVHPIGKLPGSRLQGLRCVYVPGGHCKECLYWGLVDFRLRVVVFLPCLGMKILSRIVGLHRGVFYLL